MPKVDAHKVVFEGSGPFRRWGFLGTALCSGSLVPRKGIPFIRGHARAAVEEIEEESTEKDRVGVM
jgi:hypothetical protein